MGSEELWRLDHLWRHPDDLEDCRERYNKYGAIEARQECPCSRVHASEPHRARVCSDALAESSGDGGGPRRPYFLLCQIGDQQSEQEDRGEKSDLEQKTFNAVRFKRISASKQGSPPTSLPQGQALARANSNTNRASFTSCLDCGAKAHKETRGGEVLRNKNLIKKRRSRTRMWRRSPWCW